MIDKYIQKNLTVAINDEVLTKRMMLVEEPDLSFSPSVKNNLIYYGGYNSSLINKEYSPKVVSFEFLLITNDLSQDKDWLFKTLYTNDENHLFFSMFPDRFWRVSVEGEVKFIRSMTNKTRVRVSIPFLFYDGYALSTAVRQTSASVSTTGEIEATIHNQGSIECPIDYHVKIPSDCSYFGIVSEKGVIQVGQSNMNNVSSDPELRKLVVADDAINDTFNKNWTKGGGYPSSPFPTTNSWGRVSNQGRWFMTPTGFGSGSIYHGATMWRKFSPDASGTVGSKDFEVEGRLFFLNSNGKEHGLQEVIISDSNGGTRIGFSLNKSSDGNKARIQFYNGETVGYQDFDTGANDYVSWKTGGFRIKKVGRDITFSFHARSNINYHVTTIDNVVFDTITIAAMQSSTYPAMARMWFEYIRVWRLKSAEDKKTPRNMFSRGDELYFNGESGKVYQNGVLIPDLNGSEWFNANVGTTTVKFYTSQYAVGIPEIRCEVRQRWL